MKKLFIACGTILIATFCYGREEQAKIIDEKKLAVAILNQHVGRVQELLPQIHPDTIVYADIRPYKSSPGKMRTMEVQLSPISIRNLANLVAEYYEQYDYGSQRATDAEIIKNLILSTSTTM